MSEISINKNFIGPRAIFDNDFIPPKVLYREKEIKELHSLLEDSLRDHFSMNILYQGIEGIGKKVMINKAITDLSKKEYIFNDIRTIKVDCQGKSIEELLITIITKIFNLVDFQFDLKNLWNLKIHDLWNFFKLACKKFKINYLFFFTNVEHSIPEFYKKILQYGKDSHYNMISTINTALSPSFIEFFNSFDLQIKLKFYEYNELYEILKQRALLTFGKHIDNELIQFITDLIFEHHVPVPGKGINILKILYPTLVKDFNLGLSEIYNLIGNHFGLLQNWDEFEILDYLSNSGILATLFLDNLTSYFLNSTKYYINNYELRELYFLACESIEQEKFIDEYYSLLNDLYKIGILTLSYKNKFNNMPLNIEFLRENDLFFLSISPYNLKLAIDSLFNF
ncbi:MAG: hypothetical protein ACTSRH_07820 [Promethearchaeota archaeon]